MIVREGQTPISAQKPISALIRELLDDAGEIVREEMRLAKAETSEKVSEVGRSLVPIGIGAVVGLASLILLVSALDRGLTALLAQALPLGWRCGSRRCCWRWSWGSSPGPSSTRESQRFGV